MEIIHLELIVDDIEADSNRLDQITRNLMRDLRDLGANSVERARGGEIPEGAKAIDPLFVGGLILSTMPELLPKIIEFLGSWVQLSGTHTVKVKTPNGTEVEFAPEKRMTPDEIVEFINKINTPRILLP